MDTAMSTGVDHSYTARAHAWAVCVSVVVACCLATIAAAAAPAAPTTTGHAVTDPKLGLTIPASARVHGATPSTTTAPATTTPATTAAPATSTPATTTPASGAQPGTVAPSSTSTTPGGATTPTTPSAPTTSTTTPTVGIPTTTTPATSHSTTVVGVTRKATPHKTHLSTAALVLGILGALLILGCLVWALGRWLALEPRWTVSLMHSLREASYRASATWAEFSDWARLGH